MQQAVFRFQFSWAGTRPAPTVVRSSLVLAHTLPERLFAGPAGALQVLAHLLEGVAIDLTARSAGAGSPMRSARKVAQNARAGLSGRSSGSPPSREPR